MKWKNNNKIARRFLMKGVLYQFQLVSCRKINKFNTLNLYKRGLSSLYIFHNSDPSKVYPFLTVRIDITFKFKVADL